MRVEYVVSPEEGGWSLRQGSRHVAGYDSRERALTAAEALAQAAASAGEKGVVKVRDGDALREHRSFLPDLF